MSQTHDVENLDVFRRFLTVAPFAFTVGSARLETPPAPDVSCLREGRRWFSELVRPVDPRTAQYTSRLIKEAERSPMGIVAGEAITGLPGAGFFAALESKALKKYDIGDAPLDLLVWIDGRRDTYARAMCSLIQAEFSETVLTYADLGRWHTVWVFDPDRRAILLSQPCSVRVA